MPTSAAIAEAARLLAASRAPVIAGLGTDIAGARAALLLADRLGASIDHMHSATLLRDLDVMRESGLVLTTPGEARRRGDVVLLVGDDLAESLADVWPDLDLAAPPRPTKAPERRVLRLASGNSGAEGIDDGLRTPTARADAIDGAGASLSQLVAALRARANGRPVRMPAPLVDTMDGFAKILKSAKFGIAVWSAAELDTLAIEMLCGLIRDLNARTRFAGLPLPPGYNAFGVLQACGWMTGYPMRTTFARGFPEHDPWRFDAVRLVDSGEADCAMWISSYGAEKPQWRRDIPLIALSSEDALSPPGAQVQIAVGRPGVDHAGAHFCAKAGTLAHFAAQHETGLPSVAAVLAQICNALDGIGKSPC
ncbi:MAG: tungsten formylmethanofuran dehydrogenase [Methylobacteriaceae bacterium]|nr:tungsten formylmethanofuran dehydrogenase [Methylobacteriaceae bacterium]